ncbi:MAG: cyclic lactone autoinducer peptide [Firmicutes bacterium]|nr:cyclic lactone autoinducer peptide [Bacillota bacterium]
MKKLGASLVVVFCMILSIISICTACLWVHYQPELPQKPHE